MKKHGTTILLVLILFVGMGLILYPTVSDWWNNQHQSKAIVSYNDTVNSLDSEKAENYLKKAEEYNSLVTEKRTTQLSDKDKKAYESVLDITGTGIMSHIEIPSIGVSLPVYHGISDSVLQVAVGHLEWTNLPIGGESTHCVLSGHRGLPSAKLFTNLDKLVAGDIFMLHTLDTTLTYQVDQILIVEPEDTSALGITEGQDLCTLVTCTPYGINSHRLLVRGHRIANADLSPTVVVVSEASQIEPVIVAPVVASPMLLIFLIYVMIKYRKKK